MHSWLTELLVCLISVVFDQGSNPVGLRNTQRKLQAATFRRQIESLFGKKLMQMLPQCEMQIKTWVLKENQFLSNVLVFYVFPVNLKMLLS